MTDVQKVTSTVPVTDEVLQDAAGYRKAVIEYLSATPEERAAVLMERMKSRERERAATERVPLTMERLLEKLGFSQACAEHLVQPYCGCEIGMDGWEYCQHAQDLGLTR